MKAIYVLSSPIMRPNMYKIGRTGVSRNKLITRYEPYLINTNIKIYRRVKDDIRAENYLHFVLGDTRVNRGYNERSEFFICHLSLIKKLVDSIECEKRKDEINYHNYKELKIKDPSLIGRPISWIVTKENYEFLGKKESDIGARIQNNNSFSIAVVFVAFFTLVFYVGSC